MENFSREFKNKVNPLLSVLSGNLQISESPLTPVGTISQPIQFSLVIPTYKERDNIKNVVKILSQVLDEFIPGDYELIVVDDDSPDGTWERYFVFGHFLPISADA